LKNQIFNQILFFCLFCINLLSTNLKAQDFFTQVKDTFKLNEFLNASNAVNYNLEDGLVSNYVYAINQDSLGYIWIATKAGLSRFNGNEFYNFTTKNGLNRNDNVELFKTESQRIWIANNGPLGYIENGEVKFLSPALKQHLNFI